ncbi:L,D-transpeptidase [Priestia aryabhattai]|uniref:L,D-transpeptidase n=1 Tax=Priestia aryabhattai TaxID=412384 RepID=UPI0036DB250D
MPFEASTKGIYKCGDTYGIHVNNNESSIGKYVSQGCVRMHNVDIEQLYDKVQVGEHRLRLRIPIRALLILRAYRVINSKGIK